MPENFVETNASDYDAKTGLPKDRSYLERGLPKYLERSLEAMKRSWEIEDRGEKDWHWDIYWCDLNASINAAESERSISTEQAWYLRRMYLRIFEIPLSGIRDGGEKIRYFDFLSSLKNKDCNAALKRILPRIDMNRINALIDETPYITDLQKQFYRTMLAERKKRILEKSLSLLAEQERAKMK